MEPYMDGCHHRTWHAANMNIYFMIRRMLTVLILIFLRNYPPIQVTLMLIFALINLIYTINFRPYSEGNLLEILNEVAILLCAYLMNTFL